MKRLVLFLSLFLLPLFAEAQDWNQKIDPWLLDRLRDQPTAEFIAVLSEQADVSGAYLIAGKEAKAAFVFEKLQEKALQTQYRLLTQLSEEGADYRSLFLVNAIYAKGDIELVQWMAQQPEIAYVHDNSEVTLDVPLPEIHDELNLRGPGAIEWGLERINADDVWNMGYTGQGVVVGGQDTGYDWTHPAIQPKYRGWDGATADHNYNWHDAIHEINPAHGDSTILPTNNPCGLDSPVPCDDHSHGTHTMGTMTGLDGDNIIGVAPQARWIGCRNMERGLGTPYTYIECFEWFLAPTDLNGENPDPSKAPHVIANSWSCPEGEGCNPSNFGLMQIAVDNLKASGCVVVVSAGNSGSTGCSSVSTPAAIFENSFTVGATAENDTITGFSSRGPVIVDGSGRLKPNVTAPGRNVRSCVPNGGYATWGGTSMAGPHVAGAVALIISANPDLAGEVEIIETILEQTSVPKFTDQDCGNVPGAEHPNNTYGFGRIDVWAAVQAALGITGIEPGPKQTVAASVAPNPFQDRLVVTLNGPQGEARFELYDANGRLIASRSWQSEGTSFQNISTPNLVPGIYFYRIRLNDESLNGKLIK
jgi:subtilisin family serine protease